MAAWSQDAAHQARYRNDVDRAASITPSHQNVVDLPVDSGELAQTSVGTGTVPVPTEVRESSAPRDSSDAFPEERFFDACSLALPPDLAVGEYRVVDQTGRVRTLVFSEDDLVYHGLPVDSTPRDLYTIIEGARRVYFIRVDAANDGGDVVQTPPQQRNFESPSHEGAGRRGDDNESACLAGGAMWRAGLSHLQQRARTFAAWSKGLQQSLAARWTRTSTSVRSVTQDVLLGLRSALRRQRGPERISNAQSAHETEL